jgi:hypothetical protein
MSEDMRHYLTKFHRRLSNINTPVKSTISVDCPKGFTKYYIMDNSEVFQKVKATKLAKKVAKDRIFSEKDGYLFLVKKDLCLI